MSEIRKYRDRRRSSVSRGWQRLGARSRPAWRIYANAAGFKGPCFNFLGSCVGDVKSHTSRPVKGVVTSSFPILTFFSFHYSTLDFFRLAS